MDGKHLGDDRKRKKKRVEEERKEGGNWREWKGRRAFQRGRKGGKRQGSNKSSENEEMAGNELNSTRFVVWKLVPKNGRKGGKEEGGKVGEGEREGKWNRGMRRIEKTHETDSLQNGGILGHLRKRGTQMKR